MSYEFSLKTGVYDSVHCSLNISKGEINFVVLDSKTENNIRIAEKDLLSVTILKKKNKEIDIETYNQIFTGTFTKRPDLKKVLSDFKKNINKKIYFEEE